LTFPMPPRHRWIIAIATSFPHWLVSRWIDRIGVADTERLCDAINAIPPITLRCNRLKNSLPELVDALTDQAEGVVVGGRGKPVRST
jgi:16S rRNA C967 or C1407 C5-methylase (RsmB/RsmF family)